MKKITSVLLAVMFVIGIISQSFAVESSALKSISLSKSKIEMRVGQTFYLRSTLNPKSVSKKTLTYKSDDKSIATVDNSGKVRGISTGTTKITVSSSDGKVNATCDVKIFRYRAANLKFYGGIEPEKVQGVIDNFMKLSPGINVEYIRYTNDEAGNLKLDVSIMSGQQVDLFYNYGVDRFMKRIKNGTVLSIDKYAMTDGFDIVDNFSAGIFDYEGKYYGIPTNAGPHFFILNKKMFDDAGIPLPKSWTADDFRSISNKLKKGEGENKVYGVLWPRWPQMSLVPAFAALGPDSYMNKEKTASNFANPVFKKAMKLRYDMQNVDKSELPYAKAFIENLNEGVQLLTGRVAMIYGGAWNLPRIKNTASYPRNFKVGFAPFYKMSANQTYLGNEGGLGDYISICKYTKDADAAWEFIKYYTTEGCYGLAEKAGTIPAWKKANSDRITSILLGPDANNLFDLESYRRVVLGWDGKSHVPTAPKAMSEVFDVVNTEAQKYWTNNQDLKNTMDNIKNKSDELIGKAK